MKILVTAALLPALISPTHAETCTGRVKIDVIADNGGLHIKGERLFNVGGCTFSEQDWKRILRTCSMGSRCRVEGQFGGDDFIETITSVTRVSR